MTRRPGRRVVFAYYEGCEVLDFAGPMQAFYEANSFGGAYQIEHCASERRVRTDPGLVLGSLCPLPDVGPGDLVVVPGFPVSKVRPPRALGPWLRRCSARGATITSVCSGAFVLGRAGLLERRACTTHWKRVAELQALVPSAIVLTDRLFVEDGGIVTCAGIAAGIDMALAIVESDLGPLVASRVARQMVVYIRRDAHHRQESVYLDYRTHLHPGVHAVQDWLSGHPAKKAGLGDLAKVAQMSPRNLTRAFRQATGISINGYRTRLRLEHARALMGDPRLTIEAIAAECGFAGARQLRRLWREAHRSSPARGRRQIVRVRRS